MYTFLLFIPQTLVVHLNAKTVYFTLGSFLYLSYFRLIQTFLQHIMILYIMSHKKEIQEPGLDTEEAKELELDEHQNLREK